MIYRNTVPHDQSGKLLLLLIALPFCWLDSGTAAESKPSIANPATPGSFIKDPPVTRLHEEDCIICKKPMDDNNESNYDSEEEDSVLVFEDILPKPPKQYNQMAPPKPKGKPTMVYFHVTVMTLDSINEESMTYAADIFFAQSWVDHRLRFPSNMTSEYRLLPVSWLDRIWRPDSYFKNAKQVTFQDMTIPNHYIWLHQDKTILYMVKLTLILSCAMSFHRYPHDTQQCAMKIESISYTTDDLVFVWDPMVPLVVDHIELPQLDLVRNTTGDCTQLYATGNFTCVEVVFTFKRRLGYYLFHTYIPTCLIVIMSWISFWIRPEAVPARVTLGVTSLLTLATQHSNSQKSLPPVSYIKAIDIFMSSCMVFVFLSLMEYAIINIMLGDYMEGDDERAKSRDKSGVVMDPLHLFTPHTSHRSCGHSANCPCHGTAIGQTTTDNIAKCRSSVAGRMSASLDIDGVTVTTQAVKRKNIHHQKRQRVLFVDRMSRVLFPLSFFLLNLIYWMVFTVLPHDQ